MNVRGNIPTKFSLGIFRGHFRQTSGPRNFLGSLFPRNSVRKFRGISEERRNSKELFPTTCFVGMSFLDRPFNLFVRYIRWYQSCVSLVFNRRTILDVMVNANIYPIQDESPFVEREENYEIYREIYGDDVRVVDFVFSEDSFANLVCAKIVQQEIRAKFVEDGFRAKIRPDSNCAKFVQGQKIRGSLLE
ncbi:hypothetical protein F2Q68_00017341 [Brassica cretica]|uniref:Uncharacterized protein n=1 Tax=Brassica cretica TaxID=69181 RepID=A0A8S9HG84_BRACR|nr:hypothetical protein F2Q68_00017341 [Brassica cretica]